MAKYINPLRLLYLDLSGALVSEEEKQIKQLIVSHQLDKEDMQELNGTADIFLKLEEQGHIDINNLALITQLLTSLKRQDLIDQYVVPFEEALTVDNEAATSQSRQGFSEHEDKLRNDKKPEKGVCTYKKKKARNEVSLVVLCFIMVVFTSYMIALCFEPEPKIYYTCVSRYCDPSPTNRFPGGSRRRRRRLPQWNEVDKNY
ncbi:uncharacterized protein LOC144355115 [Saccoglossus kowalevskii]